MEISYKQNIHEIELKKLDDSFAPTIDKVAQSFSLRNIHENMFQIKTDSGNVMSYCAEDKTHIFVNIDGQGFVFDKVDTSAKSYDADSGNKGNIDNVKASMPGNVVKVLVEPGQKVADGDGLIILEAMKMETTLFSSITGIVKSVNVSAGEQVDSDKILIVVEKEEEKEL